MATQKPNRHRESHRQRALSRMDQFFQEDREQSFRLAMEREIVKTLLQETRAPATMMRRLRQTSKDLGFADDLTLAAWQEEVGNRFPLKLYASQYPSIAFYTHEIFRGFLSTVAAKEYLDLLAELPAVDRPYAGLITRGASLSVEGSKSQPTGLLLVHANTVAINETEDPRLVLVVRSRKPKLVFCVERLVEWLRGYRQTSLGFWGDEDVDLD